MLNLSAARRLFIALAPVDVRGSFNRLSARAQNQLAQDPLSGHLFVFTQRFTVTG
jgi:transposase